MNVYTKGHRHNYMMLWFKGDGNFRVTPYLIITKHKKRARKAEALRVPEFHETLLLN